MYSERIERQIAHLETALRVNPDSIADILPTVIQNLRNETAELSSAEEEAFRLFVANQYSNRYGVKLGGVKGNVQLLSFDGKYKLCRDYGQLLTFDEGLQAAKELIDGCLRRWCKDSRPELRAVVEQAFKVDKKGRINTGAVLGLRRIEIDDPDWKEAMRAITESLQVLDSRVYVRAYERDSSGAYQPISLDFASV